MNVSNCELIDFKLLLIYHVQQFNIKSQFHSAVSMDQCRHESAMILFTVMDHDVITSNDFAGEAFLSLNSIPGVLAPLPHDINSIDRVDLILMHQQNKGKHR